MSRPTKNTARSADRSERKAVFDAFWGAWKKFEGTPAPR